MLTLNLARSNRIELRIMNKDKQDRILKLEGTLENTKLEGTLEYPAMIVFRLLASTADPELEPETF